MCVYPNVFKTPFTTHDGGGVGGGGRGAGCLALSKLSAKIPKPIPTHISCHSKYIGSRRPHARKQQTKTFQGLTSLGTDPHPLSPHTTHYRCCFWGVSKFMKDQSTQVGTSHPSSWPFPALTAPCPCLSSRRACSSPKRSIRQASPDLSGSGTATLFAFPARAAPEPGGRQSVCVRLLSTSEKRQSFNSQFQLVMIRKVSSDHECPLCDSSGGVLGPWGGTPG